jgi:hypothetical protein
MPTFRSRRKLRYDYLCGSGNRFLAPEKPKRILHLLQQAFEIPSHAHRVRMVLTQELLENSAGCQGTRLTYNKGGLFRLFRNLSSTRSKAESHSRFNPSARHRRNRLPEKRRGLHA